VVGHAGGDCAAGVRCRPGAGQCARDGVFGAGASPVNDQSAKRQPARQHQGEQHQQRNSRDVHGVHVRNLIRFTPGSTGKRIGVLWRGGFGALAFR
jgi:hypothetical protein